MRDNLPAKLNDKECAIINLDSIKGDGTHWVAYFKNMNDVHYFDSYGNLPPPLELLEYFGNDSKIYYNAYKYQDYDSTICGQLCVMFLYYINKQYSL